MTTNTTMRGFVPGPAERGTFDILWSCLTVLVLCAWTSLHIDLPARKEFTYFSNHPFSYDEDRLFSKSKSMLRMLVAPESILAAAFENWCEAYQAMRHVNREREFYGTDMWTMNDGFFSEMGGFTHNGEPVHARRIVELIRDKAIPPQPSRATEIRDKSKSDALGKTLTCAQALWLAIQCLTRAIQRLPISTLELGTIGYVFIAIAINGLFWYKPKDVLTPLEVFPWEARRMSPDEEESDAVHALARGVADNEEKKVLVSERKSQARWEAWLDRLTGDSYKLKQVTLISVCALYGGWHCLAWNFAFPSVAEQWLWRIGSILTCLPGLVLVVINYTVYFPVQIIDLVDSILIIAGTLLYILSRGFVFVEMFIGLRRLPAGIFETVQWMAFIPHV